MQRSYTMKAQSNAKSLRHSMTPEERHLWYDFLRGYRPKFYRQRAIGEYIADFVCPHARLVVELDGAQHYDATQLTHDERRTHYLHACGYRVLRLLNRDIKQNFAATCELIRQAVNDVSIEGRINS